MFQITLETQIKLYISNNFLVTITTIVLMSDNTGNITKIKVFQNHHHHPTHGPNSWSLKNKELFRIGLVDCPRV